MGSARSQGENLYRSFSLSDSGFHSLPSIFYSVADLFQSVNMEMEITKLDRTLKMEEDGRKREGRRGNQVTSTSKFRQNYYKITSI